MADTKISAGADPGTLLATDKAPIARSGSTTAYAATVAELAAYANGAYVPSYFGGSPSMDGTAAPGASALVSRGDHVHPVDTSRYAASNPSGYQTAAQVAAAVAPYANDVGRNLIHNPMFNVAQRGAGPFTTNGGYTLDRWTVSFVTDTASILQAPLVDGDRAQIGDETARWSLRNTFTGNAAAGAYNNVTHWIEDVHRLSGKTVTVSFWAVCLSGTLKLGVSLDQWFGSPGGGGSTQVNGTGQSVTISTTWTRFSLTFAIASASGKTLSTSANDATGLNVWFSSGTTNATRAGSVGVQSGSVWLWGAQLEVGSVATPLEKIDPGLDLRNCQRFYQIGSFQLNGYSDTGIPFGYAPPLITTMRAAPTVVPTFSTQSNCSGGTFVVTGQAVTVYSFVTAAGAAFFIGTFTASADL